MKLVTFGFCLLLLLSGCIENTPNDLVPTTEVKPIEETVLVDVPLEAVVPIEPLETVVVTSKPVRDYKVYTYEDDEGNVHRVEDYTSQGGGRFDKITIPVNTSDIVSPYVLHDIVINVTNYKDNLIIKRVLSKTDEDLLSHIESITVFYSNSVECGNTIDGFDTMVISTGCAELLDNNKVKISVISNNNGIVENGVKDICSSLEFILSHEIGHVKGYSIDVEDTSEVYADKYAEGYNAEWKQYC
ncbi:MAG: hypothetical protein KKG76_06945 [Euryarchaeota archaeon]|nr:hypothetical protein [Euryarchaeota archaeon]